MENDLDLEELRDLIKKQALLNADTNKVVHSMRRAQRMRSLMSVLWWVLIFAVSTYAYYAYVQPYVEQLLALYGQAQGAQSQFADFFNSFRPQ